VQERLSELVAERERVLAGFLEAEKGRVALCCHATARAFARGGMLIPFGTGPAATDAAHVAVEFMHPVVVGKRALPAVAPTNDPTGHTTLDRLARPGDIALGISHGAGDPLVTDFLDHAAGLGLLTIAMTGAGGSAHADYAFVVPSDDSQVAQEVQETTYHVLWELVHVFFEHPGLLDDSRSGAGNAGASAPGRLRQAYGAACITCGDVAVEARVVALRTGTALIERDGVREEVAVELVPGVEVGDVLLCHAGVALEKLS
jgi:D-sedoheptulose 7-phosphate isomerase